MARSAGEVGAAKGCKKARQPVWAGGKDFSRESTVIAKSDTLEFITCLWEENNEGGTMSGGSAWQGDAIPGKIVAISSQWNKAAVRET